MPVITKLKSQKNQKRVNIYLDNKFAFGLGLEEVIKKKIAVGQQLTEQQIEKLLFSSQFEKLYYRVLNLLSYRPRSEKEIKDYLKRNFYKTKTPAKVGEKIQSKILKKLKKLKLFDDYKFALWWIDQRLSFRPRGKRLLRAELIKKGIEREIIDKALLIINHQQLEILARKIIDKKIKLYQKLPELKLRQKLFSHLARRGFDFSFIKKAIDEKLEKR